jgi:hydroxyacylglutathione hydrolase
VALGRVETKELARADVLRLAAHRDADDALDDRDPRVLLHLVLTQLLARREHDEHRTRAVVLSDDDRVARPLRRVDREQVPVLHRRESRLAAMPPVVDRFVLSAYQSNCYVVRAGRGAREAVVVDPGGDASNLRLELARLGAQTAAIFITHTDVDHIAGVAELASGTGAEVWAPAGELEALREGRTRGGAHVAAYEPEHPVAGGDEIVAAGLTFEVVDVPGHSAGHVAFVADGTIFSGDLLFAGSVGRVDLAGGDWEALLESVRRLVDRYGRDAVVYPGHGPQTTLGRELDTNPFLTELAAAAE